MKKTLSTLAIAVAFALPAAALAQSPSDAVRAFGLVGSWSPDCAGQFRTIYAAPSGATPTVRLTMDGREIASSEIRETELLGDNRLKWNSVIKTWSLPDRPLEAWMPQPGEIWETVIEKLDDKIRPIESRRQDGQKVQVKGGFIYDGASAGDGGSIVWRNTGKETVLLSRCEAKGALRGSPHRG